MEEKRPLPTSLTGKFAMKLPGPRCSLEKGLKSQGAAPTEPRRAGTTNLNGHPIQKKRGNTPLFEKGSGADARTGMKNEIIPIFPENGVSLFPDRVSPL